MVARALVFVCVTFGLVAGSCFEVRTPQECSAPQFVSVPVQSEPSFCAPIVSDSVCSSGSPDIISSGCAPSVVCDNICSSVPSSPVFSCPQVSAPVVCESACSSGSSFSLPVVSSGASCSSGSTVSLPVVSSGSSFYDVFSSASGSSSSGSSSGLQPGNGPEASLSPVIQAPAVTLPAVEGPTITLSSQPIPAPRVLAQRCICTKTIVKPQVYQRLVTVPRIQRYVKRTYTPVVENVAYKSTPISQGTSSGSSSSSSVVLSSGYGSGSYGSSSNIVLPSEYGSCGSQSVVCSPVVVPSGSSCAKIC